MRVLPFGLVYLVPLAVVLGHLGGGWWNFLTPVAVYLAIPLLDLLVGRDPWNPSPEAENVLADMLDFRVLTWLAAPVQVALMIWGAHVIGTQHLTLVELIGFTFSVGTCGGILGINLAHELAHKHNAFERFLSATLLWTTGYMHWGLEHVAGHHAHVATPHDPATARFGESFYRFWPRTVLGSFASIWHIEAARLQRKGASVWSWRNRVIRDVVLIMALVVGLGALWGSGAVLFYIAQALVAISLLEVVNYLEHYGLLRTKDENGRYERVAPRHSWNASERVTNYFLINLQRHSDHHYKPTRRYQILRRREDAPQLPTGYGGMLVLALIPPLWFAVMNPRVPEENLRLREAEIAAGNLPG